MIPARSDLVEKAQLHLGAPYIWRGKGLYLSDDVKGLVPHTFGCAVFDCSGFYTSVLWEAGCRDMRSTHNAQLLSMLLPRTDAPKAGDAAFYGPDWKHVDHVMMVTTIHDAFGNAVTGASGAGHDCTSLEIAAAKHARVHIASVQYRRDFLGYGSVAAFVSDP
jgi:cell wall-associated NlpC family hydrolase